MEIPAPALHALFGELAPAALAEIRARLELIHLARGEVLYRQGAPAETMHILLTGRLQVRVSGEGDTDRLITHILPGQSVGETALFTGGLRSATVVASRDSTVASVSRPLFDRIIAESPQAGLHLSRLIIGRLSASQTRRAIETPLRNIAIVPLQPHFPIAEFGRRLQIALLSFGRTGHLDARTVANLSGRAIGANGDPLATARFLDDFEEQHDFVIYRCDPNAGDWTRTCIGYADKVLLIGHAAEPLLDSPLAEQVLQLIGADGPEVALVMVHPDGDTLPQGTRARIDTSKIDRHYHLGWRGSQGFNRIARLLSNKAVTLVLGGGGARGLAHIGVIRALREQAVPIDAVGGTSFGALMAAAVALGHTDEELIADVKTAFADQQPTNDYTLPLVSLVRGEKMRASLMRFCGDYDIEDLWLPFFAVSCNLSRNRMVVHTRGPLWRALRATVSLPAVFPPMVENGELLVDGGLLNNLPVDEMKARIPGMCIAVDLSVEEEFHVQAEVMPGALELLKSKLVPYSKPINVPTLDRLLVKATTLSSRREVDNARQAAHLYLNPPVAGFDLLRWDRFYDLIELGYRYAMPRVEQWLQGQPQIPQREEIFHSRFFAVPEANPPAD